MAISLAEAATATGVNRSTIYRAWKAGRISASKTDTGQIEVDPAELFRVFPPVAPQQGAQGETHQHAQVSDAHENALQVSALEVEVKLLREMLDTMREDRDAWREQAGKITAALPAPVPAAPLQAPRRPWWRRLAG
jgi:hypothetical protein